MKNFRTTLELGYCNEEETKACKVCVFQLQNGNANFLRRLKYKLFHSRAAMIVMLIVEMNGKKK